jgi:hypothetical protein
MVRRRIMAKILTGFCIIVLLGGCGNRLSPLEVSERFWAAVQQGDTQAMQRHIASGTIAGQPGTGDMLAVTGADFGRTIIDAERASVETTLTVGDEYPYKLPIETYLLQENRAWKIDYNATVAVIRQDGRAAALLDTIQRINEALSRQLQDSLMELQDLMPLLERELAILGQSLKDSLPELRRQLEEALRELEKSLPEPQHEPREEGAVET